MNSAFRSYAWGLALFRAIRSGLPGAKMLHLPRAVDRVASMAAFLLTAPVSSNRAPGEAGRREALFFGAARAASALLRNRMQVSGVALTILCPGG